MSDFHMESPQEVWPILTPLQSCPLRESSCHDVWPMAVPVDRGIPYEVSAPSVNEVIATNQDAWLVNVVIVCSNHNQPVTFQVLYDELAAYELGKKLIQDAMPSLDAGHREMFMTGICPDCFSRIMPPEEDEDNDDDDPFSGVMSSSNC